MTDSKDLSDMPQERMATRFLQIVDLEKKLAKIRKRISDKKTELGTLAKQEKDVVEAILSAARDEGDVPLLFTGAEDVASGIASADENAF